MKTKVAIYLRVSTQRQAKQDVSIPDQRKQAHDYCHRRGWDIAKEYVEAGKSATDDRRPEFQKMISDACSKNHPFDTILVYSFSRFFRDAIDSGVYRRRLEKHDVSVESMTQDFGDGHDGELLKNIIASVDEHASKENGKNTLSRMIENAKQGFWNGAAPPYGYKVYTHETRGEKEKKKLKIDTTESEIIRKIYRHYIQGMGIKAIATWLNEHGYSKRKNRPFYTANVHSILSQSTYIGRHYFNKTNSKTGKRKPKDEWVEIECPPVITKEQYQAVQQLLKNKRQNISPSRKATACTLLNGIAKCSRCNCNYMLMTSGKHEKYKYYKPTVKMLQRSNNCDCKNIPMQYLDDLIMQELADRMQPNFIKGAISDLSQNYNSNAELIKADLKLLRTELKNVESRLNNLYDSVAEGRVRNFDSFDEFINKEVLKKDDLTQQISQKQKVLHHTYNFSNKQLVSFSKTLKSSFLEGPVEFRKRRLQEFVSYIEIGDTDILIKASKTALAEAMLDMKRGGEKVRSCVREWHAVEDTNTNLEIVVELPEKYRRKKKLTNRGLLKTK